MKIPYRFDPDTEAKYLEIKFQESRTVVIMVGFATSLLAVVLWAWDWVIDPVHAMGLLGSRVILGAILILYPLGILFGIKRRFLPWFFYAVILTTQAFFLHHLSRMDTGLVYGISGFMYWFILPVFLAFPYSTTSSILGFVAIAVHPNILVWAGIATHFELAKYNIIIWPTCIIVIFAAFMLDLLFRGIFVQMNERKKLITELQDSIAAIKTLRGLMPICSSCKKVRDDKGYWKQIESYIAEHSEAEFSHGICPDCMEKLYPEYPKKKNEEK
jgi:MASE8